MNVCLKGSTWKEWNVNPELYEKNSSWDPSLGWVISSVVTQETCSLFLAEAE